MAQLFAGTSGFAYPAWKPRFYPDKLPAKKFLQYYSGRLNAVEINYTYRRLPAASTLTGWVEATPAGFLFAPKAHMRITHILKLKDAGDFTALFLKAIDPLRSARRLGPILFQLPPTLHCDLPLLSDFLARLPDDLRYTFEFRHASWLARAVCGGVGKAGDAGDCFLGLSLLQASEAGVYCRRSQENRRGRGAISCRWKRRIPVLQARRHARGRAVCRRDFERVQTDLVLQFDYYRLERLVV